MINKYGVEGLLFNLPKDLNKLVYQKFILIFASNHQQKKN